MACNATLQTTEGAECWLDKDQDRKYCMFCYEMEETIQDKCSLFFLRYFTRCCCWNTFSNNYVTLNIKHVFFSFLSNNISLFPSSIHQKAF